MEPVSTTESKVLQIRVFVELLSTTESKVPSCLPIINRFPSFDCPVNKPEPPPIVRSETYLHFVHVNLENNCCLLWRDQIAASVDIVLMSPLLIKAPEPYEDEQVSPSPTEDNSNKFKIKCKQQHSSSSPVII